MEHVGDLLGAYYDGELPEQARERVEAHLRECSRCCGELGRVQALSRTLSAYRVPDLEGGAEKFRAQVVLRLGRRRPVGNTLSGWWYLVPVGLISAIASLLALLTLPGLLALGWALLDWAGIDPALLLEVRTGIEISTEGLAWLRGMGALAWRGTLYSALLLLFGSYVGWVSVLWRTETQLRAGKER